jgi:hypothetical protein
MPQGQGWEAWNQLLKTGVLPASAIPPLSGGVGAEIAYTSPTGTIDPAITGFVAGLQSAGTGRIRLTITANTSWQGLPAGVDGQTLTLEIVAGNFTFELLANDASTALKEILCSGSPRAYQLYDAPQLQYSGNLTKWVLRT